MQKINLITAPLFYANDKPHLGHIYTSVLIDIFKKHLFINNIDSFLVVGVDEHGQKISETARLNKRSIREHLNLIQKEFKNALNLFRIDYDYFLSTTSSNHVNLVLEKIDLLKAKHAIYEGEYSGFYSIKDEEYLTNSEVIHDGEVFLTLKDRSPVQIMKQKALFLKTSNYFSYLKNELLNNNYIYPNEKSKEIYNMLKNKNFGDLCISRENVWGIHLPNTDNLTLYVWVDALYGYYTSLENSFGNLNNYQINSFHLIGKEIVKFHAIYLPILLKLSNTIINNLGIFSHQWILCDGKKMSKTEGNTININKLTSLLPIDAIRFFLFMKGPLTKDTILGVNEAMETYRIDLVNKFSNLFYRTLTMVKNYNLTKWYLINPLKILTSNKKVLKMIKEILSNLDYGKNNRMLINSFLKLAIIKNRVFSIIEEGNFILTSEEPWKLFKANKELETLEILFFVIFLFIFVTFLFFPIFPTTTRKILNSIGLNINQIKFIWLKHKDANDFLLSLINLVKICQIDREPIKVFQKLGEYEVLA